MSDENEPVTAATGKPPMIHAAIIAIMRAIEPIAKSQKNVSQNYQFRGIDQVYNAVHPHFAKHGVFSTSRVLNVQTIEKVGKEGKTNQLVRLTMQFTFWAEDGSHVSTEVVGEGMDYGGDKASNKAMSAADKYAILQLLKIPTAAVDSDKTELPNPDQNAERPAAGTRRERSAWAMTGKMFTDLWTEYWDRNKDSGQTDAVLKANFESLVAISTGRKFQINKPANWTRADYDAVIAAIGIPTDVELGG